MADLVLPDGINDGRGRAIAALLDRFAGIDLTKLLIYRIDEVDASALPHLVDQFDLHDVVDAGTPEAATRRLIKQAIELRRYMGTPWAVRKTLEAFGAEVDLVEWWQEVPRGTPHTFRVTAWFDRGLLEEDFETVDRLVRWSKRTSQHQVISVGFRTRGVLRVGMAGQSGETCTILPWRPPDPAPVHGAVPRVGIGLTAWEITTILPLQS